MTFQNCLQGANAGFGISAMVEGGVILAVMLYKKGKTGSTTYAEKE